MNGDKKLFTVVMHFEGTTSVVQFEARSVQEAHMLWLRDLDLAGMFGLDEDQRDRLLEGSKHFDPRLLPMPLPALQNMFCAGIRAKGGGLALLNIIETVSL